MIARLMLRELRSVPGGYTPGTTVSLPATSGGLDRLSPVHCPVGDAYPFLYVEVAVVGSLTIVVNPAAGGGRAIRHLPVVRTVLDAAGARYLICQSSSLGHARAIAAEAAVRGDP
jgi:hypothetical protein